MKQEREFDYLKYRPNSEPSEGIVCDPLLPRLWARRDLLFLASTEFLLTWGGNAKLVAPILDQDYLDMSQNLSTGGDFLFYTGLAGMAVYFTRRAISLTPKVADTARRKFVDLYLQATKIAHPYPKYRQ